MALFQKSVLNKHLNHLDESKVAQAYEKYQENYNLQREFKNQNDGKKADGAILKDDKALAIIELKSTKTKDLTKVAQQEEWEDYFTTYKTEINHLQTQITQTDNEIDAMVYKLYRLTDEEIAIVENA